MIDIFGKEDMHKLLQNKSVVLMGDSNVRALYKDFLCLLNKTQFIPDKILKHKMESSCFGDKLVYHGEKSNGRDYKEEREVKIGSTSLSFFFLTQVYNKYVKQVLKKIEEKGLPDILIINCCLWDVTRWGPTGVEDYKKNLKTLMLELKKLLPNCLVIWVTAPPIACELKGGFLLKELQFLKYSLRFHVVEANHYARNIVVGNGFDVLDSHYHLKMQIHRRTEDGIHWYPEAVRYVTNLLLTHISLALNKPLPHRYKSEIMEQNLETLMEDKIKVGNSKDEGEKDTTGEEKRKVCVSSAQETVEKHNRENCTPKRKKKRKSHSVVSYGGISVHDRNTHHAFLRREEKNQRHKRIRQWKQPNTAYSTSSFPYSSSSFMSPVAHRYHGFTRNTHHSPLLPNPYPQPPCQRESDFDNDYLPNLYPSPQRQSTFRFYR